MKLDLKLDEAFIIGIGCGLVLALFLRNNVYILIAAGACAVYLYRDKLLKKKVKQE